MTSNPLARTVAGTSLQTFTSTWRRHSPQCECYHLRAYVTELSLDVDVVSIPWR